MLGDHEILDLPGRVVGRRERRDRLDQGLLGQEIVDHDVGERVARGIGRRGLRQLAQQAPELEPVGGKHVPDAHGSDDQQESHCTECREHTFDDRSVRTVLGGYREGRRKHDQHREYESSDGAHARRILHARRGHR